MSKNILHTINDARSEAKAVLKKIEQELNSSQEWKDYSDAVYNMLKEKHKARYDLLPPSLSIMVHGLELNEIRIYASQFINKRFTDLFKSEIKKKVFSEELDFSYAGMIENGVVLKSTQSLVLKYQVAYGNLVKLVSRISHDFYLKESDYYHDYFNKKQHLKGLENAFNDKLLSLMYEPIWFDKTSDKLNHYFDFSPLGITDLSFSSSIYHEGNEYENGETKTYYGVSFYCAEYERYKRVSLGSFKFNIDDLSDIKWQGKIIKNMEILPNDIKGVSYINRTLKKHLQTMLLDAVQNTSSSKRTA